MYFFKKISLNFSLLFSYSWFKQCTQLKKCPYSKNFTAEDGDNVLLEFCGPKRQIRIKNCRTDEQIVVKRIPKVRYRYGDHFFSFWQQDAEAVATRCQKEKLSPMCCSVGWHPNQKVRILWSSWCLIVLLCTIFEFKPASNK